MRRIFAITAVIVLIACLGTVATAATSASGIHVSIVVSSDGTCQVTQIVNFHLEQVIEDLTYPLPAGARDVSVNGTAITPSRDGTAAYIHMDRITGTVTGDFTTTFRYTLNSLVDYNEDKLLVLNLPILSGFAYPVDSVAFTITLPGETEYRPTFSSGYFKTRIQENMDITVSGSQISGQVLVPLKDRETLHMALVVDRTMFPPSSRPVWTAGTDDFAIAALAVLALVYWLVFLRCMPVFRTARSAPPDGIGAGEVGSVMVMAGADLTMMVVSWAQMGYILMQLDNNGRVLLHRRMDMGNERSAFERRLFKLLFGRRSIIDGTGYHYAQLCRKVAAGKPNIQGMYHRASGNPKLFRIIAAAAGIFGGISMGMSAALSGWTGTALTVILAILGAVSAWFIQSGGKYLHLRNKQPLILALVLCGVWIGLGIWAGDPVIALLTALGQLLAGILAAYGGRRTELGRQTLQQIYGLRHNLKHPDRTDLQRIMKQNPAYFYTMAPYALAFGVDLAFAKGFGGMRLSGCPYLTTGMDGHLTASDWCKLLRKAVNILDERQKQLPLERLLGR